MNGDFSRKTARILEICAYLCLIPATFGLFLSILATVVSKDLTLAVFPLIVLLTYAFGLVLLVGYRKRAQGKLSRAKTTWMWCGSIIFNVLCVLPVVYLSFVWFGKSLYVSTIETLKSDYPTFIIFGIIYAYYLITAILSGVALSYDLKRKFE